MGILYGSSGDVRLEAGDPSEQEVSASLLNLGRIKATRLVDSYLERVYPGQVPIAASGDVPLLVDSLVNSLAVYYIFRSLHRGINPISKDVKEEYWDKPMETLKMLLDRELDLPEFSGVQSDRVIGSRSSFTPIFDVDDDLSSEVDPDLLDDIEDKRS